MLEQAIYTTLCCVLKQFIFRSTNINTSVQTRPKSNKHRYSASSAPGLHLTGGCRAQVWGFAEFCQISAPPQTEWMWLKVCEHECCPVQQKRNRIKSLLCRCIWTLEGLTYLNCFQVLKKKIPANPFSLKAGSCRNFLTLVSPKPCCI